MPSTFPPPKSQKKRGPPPPPRPGRPPPRSSALAELSTAPRPPHVVRPSAVAGFLLVHVAAALGVVLVGFSWTGVALCVASYYLRMFAITAGFHRYFSHRAYRLSRVSQFLLAFLGQTSAQKG